ncbi:hypothetical protein HOG27_01065 [bacterium]|nr:hypothetical protein [bacterium]
MSAGSNIIISLALSFGAKSSTSSTKSPCGSIIHNPSPFRRSCLAKYQINTDFQPHDFQIT